VPKFYETNTNTGGNHMLRQAWEANIFLRELRGRGRKGLPGPTNTVIIA
jgi:hypothetical protein